jgi:ferredoxin
MRITIDFDRCSSSALRMEIAPEVFELDDDDMLHVLNPEPDRALHDAVRRASQTCPKQAIALFD